MEETDIVALEKYRTALTFVIAYSPTTGDSARDQQIKDEFLVAEIAVEKLRRTDEYYQAIQAAGVAAAQIRAGLAERSAVK
jgi:hypothetical protein